MKNLAFLTVAIGLALAGCGDNLVEDPGDDGSGSDVGSGSGDGEQPDPTLDVTGTYRLNSTFDIATNMPGSAGAFVNGLIAATDDPDDPMSWLLDQMLAQLPDGTFKDILAGAKPFVAGYLNDQLTELAPELVGTITEMGHHMADITKHLGVNEVLEVKSSDQVLISRVSADGVRFTIDGTATDLDFFAYGVEDAVADGVLVTFENNSRLTIGEHSLALPYGAIVRMGLDAAIIPTLDPAATNLTELLDDIVDCQAVGQGVADALEIGSAAFWASACTGGLGAAADLVYDQIAATDSTLTFHVTGAARVSDTNHDFKVDTLSHGTWAGTVAYDETETALVQPATFVGERL